MQRELLKVGMKVRFGKPNGEKTIGEILKLNPTTAKIRTHEERGSHSAGQIWRVPYSMIEINPPSEPLSFNSLTETELTETDTLILKAICQTYTDLNPENLKVQHYLKTRLHHLQLALGRTVSQTEAREWEKKT